MRTLVLAVAVLAAVTADCGAPGRFVHPTKSAAEFAGDEAQCKQEAAKRFPPLYQASEVGDQNERSREGSVSRCLYERGWRWKADGGSPAS